MFDCVENHLQAAFKAFEGMDYKKAEEFLDAAFKELMQLSSGSNVDLSWADALWQNL